MSDCVVKISDQAWNDGIDAFEKSFLLNNNPTAAMQFALDEIARQHPDMQFDPKSFTDPLIKSLKADGLVPNNFKFGKTQRGSQARIEKVINKMSGLDENQKKKIASQAFKVFEKDGTLTTEAVKNLYAEALGLPSASPYLDQKIIRLAKARQAQAALENEIDTKIREHQDLKDNEKFDKEADKKFQKEFEALAAKREAVNNEALKAAHEFSNMLMEKKFFLHQLTDYMTLNLMNPNSLMKNVSGMVADGLVRTLSSTMASPISAFVSLFTKINSQPIGAKIRGLKNANVRSKASAAWSTGVTDFQSELPKANNLNVTQRWKRAMEASGLEKWKGMLSTMLKVHPSLVSKGLTVPDAMAYEMIRAMELQQIGESKGLKGADLAAFMLKPDEASHNEAHEAAKKATFKDELPEWLSWAQKLSSYDPHEATKKLVADGKMSPTAAKIVTFARAALQKSIFPFVKTPVNLIKQSSKILFPEYILAKSAYDAYKETDPAKKQKIIIQGTTDATAGFLVRMLAFELISKGLLSGGYSDEDYKTKDVVEQMTGGPNRVNLSALLRGLTFRGVEQKEGDTYADLNSLGTLGIAMAVYAHTYGRLSEDEMKEKTSYNKDLAGKLASVPADELKAMGGTAIDLSFLTGLNQLQEALLNKEGKKGDRYAINLLANMFTGVVPATAQKLSTQIDPNIKKQFDPKADFTENLANVLGYRFAFQSEDLKNKYFSLDSDGDARKKKSFLMLNNYLGRLMESEIDFVKATGAPAQDTPIGKLYMAGRKVPADQRDAILPPSINEEISIKYKENNRQVSKKTKLSQDQYEYLQQQASNYRMILATPYIMSEDFDNATHEQRASELQRAYTEGLNLAKQDLIKVYPDILEKIADAPSGEDDDKEVKEKYKNIRKEIVREINGDESD